MPDLHARVCPRPVAAEEHSIGAVSAHQPDELLVRQMAEGE